MNTAGPCQLEDSVLSEEEGIKPCKLGDVFKGICCEGLWFLQEGGRDPTEHPGALDKPQKLQNLLQVEEAREKSPR